MSNVTQFVQNRNTPRQWGFADGIAGVSEFEGYNVFAGKSLTAYIDGHHAGQAYARKYSATLPHLTAPALEMPALRMPLAVQEWQQGRARVDVRRLSGGSEQPKAHRKYQEGRDMDQELFELRNGKEPILRYTDEMMEEIEAERF